jgi:hypothetical protein
VRAIFVAGPQLVTNLTMLIGMNGRDSTPSDAQRRLRAVLRRSRALGSATDVKWASSEYGFSILSELAQTVRTRRAPERFLMAITLLIKGGLDVVISNDVRSEALLNVYLDNEAIDRVIATANAQPAVRDDRTGSAVKLFAAWATALPAGRTDIAQRLITWIAETGASYAEGPGLNVEVWQLCLDELKRVPIARPGLAQLASRSVTDLVVMTVRQNRFRLTWAALETGAAYANELDFADLKRLAETALDVLEGTAPADAAWTIVRPAMEIICSPDLKDSWPQDTDLARRTARTMLRYGTEMDGEGPRLLVYMDDLVPYLEPGPQSLVELISEMGERAQAISSSGATAYMSGSCKRRTLSEAKACSRRCGACGTHCNLQRDPGRVSPLPRRRGQSMPSAAILPQ